MALAHAPASTSATFSPCGVYRYTLGRRWDDGDGHIAYVMLNPSTADAEQDDPTIRRCIGFARSWGYSTFTATNIFALRSTDASGLGSVEDPIGAGNARAIRRAVGAADLTILAWGTSIRHVEARILGRALRAVARACAGRPTACFGLTKHGHPRHPLYVRGDTAPVPCTVRLAHEKGAARSDRPVVVELVR